MIKRSWVQSPVRMVGDFSSPGSAFCADFYFSMLHPCVPAVAHKRSQPLCQKCKWQVTARHAHTNANGPDVLRCQANVLGTAPAPSQCELTLLVFYSGQKQDEYGCQCLGSLTCSQMLIHIIAYWAVQTP